MGLEQIGIALSGVIAVRLTQDRRATWRRLACVFGMVAQPFWFYAAWKAEQWGIFAMCTLYTYAWTRGVWIHWIYPFLASWQVRAAGIRHQSAGRVLSQYREGELAPEARSASDL
jgi:hypothetical protein